MTSFHFREEYLYCENICIEKLLDTFTEETTTTFINADNAIRVQVPPTPLYIYSSQTLKDNVTNYLEAMKKYSINGKLGYAVKANGNPHLLKLLKSYGVHMLVTVSGNEIIAGLKSGFLPNEILFNGNGKQSWEIKLAIEQGVFLNVDSIFDANRIVNIISAEFSTRKVKVLLRLRPSSVGCEVGVHPYINTSTNSKFGFGLDELDKVIDILETITAIQVYGVHCHLGSCILDPNVYSYIGKFIGSAVNMLEARGITIELCDFGGGIGIDYRKIPSGFKEDTYYGGSDASKSDGKSIPTIDEFMKILADVLPADTQLLIEPGRSLVGNAGIIVTNVLGCKTVAEKNYMVVDAAMTELIRPSLYQSFHQIFPTKLNETNQWKIYDVVGPVCESADFLGHNISLHESNYLAIMDCGAYAASMASNYNMRPKPLEMLVTGKEWTCIRERECFQDLTAKTAHLNQE